MSESTRIVNNRDELRQIASDIRGGQTVLCSGHFNVIHPGHRRFLEHAKSLGQRLVAAVIDDTELRAQMPLARLYDQLERAKTLAGHSHVDLVVMLGQVDIDELIEILRPDTYILGKEFEDQFADRVANQISLVHHYGGRVVYHSGRICYVADSLGEQPISAVEMERSAAFNATCSRIGVNINTMSEDAANFSKRRVVVLGDSIVDQYVACDALGMSAEAPVVALKELRSREYIGGAAIVACHVRSLGARCDFISVSGEDAPANFLTNSLKINGVNAHILRDTSRPTTFKIRYMVGNQKLLRVSRLDEGHIPRAIEKKIIDRLSELVPHADGLVVSDFVYGLVTPNVLDAATELCRNHQVKIFGDLQCSSQIGSILRFKEFTLICPNEREARIALGDKDSGIEQVAHRLIEQTSCKGLLLTLGPNGCVAYDKSGPNTTSESYPALDPNPIDVTGAGDAMLAATAVAMSSGWPLLQAAALGAVASSLAVGRMGNIPVTLEEARQALSRLHCPIDRTPA